MNCIFSIFLNTLTEHHVIDPFIIRFVKTFITGNSLVIHTIQYVPLMTPEIGN